MITVASAVEQIIKKLPYIEEALGEGIINLSALARLILPEVRVLTYKRVQEGAVLMALKRMPKLINTSAEVKEVLKKSHDLITRSNLVEFTVLNLTFTTDKHRKIIEETEKTGRCFLTITQGMFETTVIVSQELKEVVEKILGIKNIVSYFDKLSSVTVHLPGKTVLTPGVYYSILKSLAWGGINVVEVVSTFSEFTIILKDKEVERAFSLLKNISS